MESKCIDVVEKIKVINDFAPEFGKTLILSMIVRRG